MKDQVITIQQKKDRMLLILNEHATNEEIVNELKKKINKLKKLYGNEKTPIYVTGKVLKNKEIEEINEIIKEFIDVDIEFDSPTDMGLSSIKKTFENEIEKRLETAERKDNRDVFTGNFHVFAEKKQTQ